MKRNGNGKAESSRVVYGDPAVARGRPAAGYGDANRLSDRENRVLELLSGGLIQKEVATNLGCSLRFVKKLVTAARKRLGARTREQLIRLWLEKRLGS